MILILFLEFNVYLFKYHAIRKVKIVRLDRSKLMSLSTAAAAVRPANTHSNRNRDDHLVRNRI